MTLDPVPRLEFDPTMLECARAVLHGETFTDHKSFLRLRSAGVIAGESLAAARICCALYRDFLAERLR